MTGWSIGGGKSGIIRRSSVIYWSIRRVAGRSIGGLLGRWMTPVESLLRRALAFHILVDQGIMASENAMRWKRYFTPAVGSIARHNRGEIHALAARLQCVQLENIDALALLERL